MILITGAARSGTSLVTEILQAHGVCLGRPEDINGLYENVRIRDGYVKPYLEAAGCDPMGQGVLPDPERLPPATRLRCAVEQAFQGRSEPRAYKGAKMCLMWPEWSRVFPSAKWVIVRRDRKEIIHSCQRTTFMSGRSRASEWAEWLDVHERRFEEMRASLEVIEVWPRDFIENARAFAPVADHCGLRFNLRAVRESVNDGLYAAA